MPEHDGMLPDAAEQEQQTEPEQKLPGSFALSLIDWVDSAVYSVLIVILLFSFCFRYVGVDGSSMYPTLKDKDQILLNSAFCQPENGDIVVFTKLSQPLVKRIIASEGQVVDIDKEAGIVYVDGVPLSEPYINEPTRTLSDVDFPGKVPPGCFFVLGDNRNASSDSRSSIVGMVDERHVIGKVVFRLTPLPTFGKIEYSTW